MHLSLQLLKRTKKKKNHTIGIYIQKCLQGTVTAILYIDLQYKMNSTTEIPIYIQIEMFLQEYRRDRSEQNYYTKGIRVYLLVHIAALKRQCICYSFFSQSFNEHAVYGTGQLQMMPNSIP